MISNHLPAYPFQLEVRTYVCVAFIEIINVNTFDSDSTVSRDPINGTHINKILYVLKYSSRCNTYFALVHFVVEGITLHG